MSLWSWFTKEKTIAVDFLKAQAVKLTMLDSKPGLSVQDVGQILQWFQVARDMSNATNEEKFKWVVSQIETRFKGKVSPWVVQQVATLLYQYAKAKGIV